MFEFSTITVLLTCLSVVMATNYCDPALCGSRVTHIGCNNLGGLGPNCPADAQFITLTADQINRFLDLHNTRRAMVASGSLAGFSSARNMSVLQWDDELAYLAGLNAKTCVFAHDKCRATDAFKWAGQNIAIRAGKPNFPDATINIQSTINDWFSENKVCSMTYINNYSSPTNGAVIGHFTVMVTDRTTKIGCAMARYTDAQGWKTILTVCNYSFTNMLGQPIYKSGPACADCVKGCSSTYVGLCNP